MWVRPGWSGACAAAMGNRASGEHRDAVRPDPSRIIHLPGDVSDQRERPEVVVGGELGCCGSLGAWQGPHRLRPVPCHAARPRAESPRVPATSPSMLGCEASAGRQASVHDLGVPAGTGGPPRWRAGPRSRAPGLAVARAGVGSASARTTSSTVPGPEQGAIGAGDARPARSSAGPARVGGGAAIRRPLGSGPDGCIPPSEHTLTRWGCRGSPGWDRRCVPAGGRSRRLAIADLEAFKRRWRPGIDSRTVGVAWPHLRTCGLGVRCPQLRGMPAAQPPHPGRRAVVAPDQAP